jgi:hypothetical protein
MNRAQKHIIMLGWLEWIMTVFVELIWRGSLLFWIMAFICFLMFTIPWVIPDERKEKKIAWK